MKLLEFQGKRLLSEAGVPTPRGCLLFKAEDVAGIKEYPVFLKAQAPAGKRGKAGAIQRVDDQEEAALILEKLLSMEVGGFPVGSVLAEEALEIEQELYLSVLTDKKVGRPLVVTSAYGGMDIEDAARENPDKVVKMYYDPFLGVQDYQVRTICKKIGLSQNKEFGSIVRRLIELAETYEADLIEINPLAVTNRGLVALDAKINLDDKSAFRSRELHQSLAEEQKNQDRSNISRAEKLAREAGMQYVPLDGDIGLIADGAGTGMLSLDLISDVGGRPANFCEMGGQANAEYMEKALNAVSANPRVKAVLVSLIGGLTRMDHLAEGIAAYLDNSSSDLPLVVRMCGTKADVGVPLLKSRNLAVYEDLTEAARHVVQKAVEVTHGSAN